MDVDLNPIEILYSWQAILIAVAATGITQLIKTVVDITVGKKALSRLQAAAPDLVLDMPPGAVGKEKRQDNVWINRLLLPMAPIAVGAVFAVVVPARPDVIVAYVTAHEVGWTQYLIYAAWGAACGQFSSYVYDRVMEAVRAKIKAAVAGATDREE